MNILFYSIFAIIVIALTVHALFIDKYKKGWLKNERLYLGLICFLSVIAAFIYAGTLRGDQRFEPTLMYAFATFSMTVIAVITLLLFIREAFGIRQSPAPANTAPTQAPPAARSAKASPPSAKKLNILDRMPSDVKLFLILLLAAAASRFGIYVLGYIYRVLSEGMQTGFAASFYETWFKWDTGQYTSIAENWYQNTGEAKYSIVFYPLYPLIIRTLQPLFGNYFTSALVISNFCLGLGCFYIYKLVKLDSDENSSLRAVKYLLIYPFSLFCGLAFTESLFIALSAMTLYYLRKEKWFIAGFCGFLAASSRSQGILLFLPAIMEYLTITGFFIKIKSRNAKNAFKHFFTQGIYTLLIPVGTFLFLLQNKVVTGDWFTFIRYQDEHWQNRFEFFANVLRGITESALNVQDQYHMTIWKPAAFSFLLVIFLIFYSFKKIRTSYIAYMAAYLIISYSPSWLLSAPRYILALTPIYIVLSLMTARKGLDWAFTFISTLLLGYYVLAFVMWRVI